MYPLPWHKDFVAKQLWRWLQKCPEFTRVGLNQKFWDMTTASHIDDALLEIKDLLEESNSTMALMDGWIWIEEVHFIVLQTQFSIS